LVTRWPESSDDTSRPATRGLDDWRRFDCARAAEEVVVRVKDTGIGITPDLLPRIFDLFVQADHGADRAHGGLGLRLTLVRSLVEMHNGTVVAHSQGAGTGAEFVVHLPLASPEARGTAAEPESSAPLEEVLRAYAART
jgi:signal transduction histidine kinase